MSKKLPENPDLDQLKAQAKELLKAARSGDGEAVVRLENYQLRAEGKRLMLADAQLVVSREYGYSSWRKLKNHVDHIRGDRPTPLETAILHEDVPLLKSLLAKNPTLVRLPQKWKARKQAFKPLTFACNFRKLESARTLLRHGADAEEDHNYPLFRAGLFENQEALLDLLLEHGADVNGIGLSFDGTDWGPVILGACETLAVTALLWFIRNGADVDFFFTRANGEIFNCADMLMKTYVRRPAERAECMKALFETGARIPDTPFTALIARNYERLEQYLKEDSKLLERRWHLDELLQEPFFYDGDNDFTPVEQTTLLHIAIEQHDFEFAQSLLDHGADVNARAAYLEDGSGGHTPLFHAAVANSTSPGGSRVRVEFLLERGA